MWTFARTPGPPGGHVDFRANSRAPGWPCGLSREPPGPRLALLRIPGTSDVDSRGLPGTRGGFPGWNGSELRSGRISVNFSPNGRWNSSGWHRPGMARQGGSLKRTIVLSQGIPTRDMQFMCKLLIRALMDRFCHRTSAEEFREVAVRRRGISRGRGSVPRNFARSRIGAEAFREVPDRRRRS